VKLLRPSTPARVVPAAGAEASPAPELIAQRERLTERFALMQSELGGLFYEMAIRDHVQMDVLITKAAALQRVDSELHNSSICSTTERPESAGNAPPAPPPTPGEPRSAPNAPLR
jgi:hypothetical protein